MRAAEGDPRSPRPLADELPAAYSDDALARRIATGLDPALGPVITTLDNLEAYLSPGVAPEDFLMWLAGWVGAEMVGDEPVAIRREVVADAVTMHRRRGTRAGLVSAVRVATGTTPEIEESGGSEWSARPLGRFPGSSTPSLVVRLRVPDPSAVNRPRLDAAVAAAVPTHLPFTIDVVGTDGSEPSSR